MDDAATGPTTQERTFDKMGGDEGKEVEKKRSKKRI